MISRRLIEADADRAVVKIADVDAGGSLGANANCVKEGFVAGVLELRGEPASQFVDAARDAT